MRPDCPRPYATFHFAPGKPASRNSVCGAAQLAARLRRSAQTNGGKSEHDATLSCGSVARRPNSVLQALTHGWVRIRAACETFYEMGFSQGTAMGSSYQFNKKAILHPHSVSPLVPTPVTASSWGWLLHRRVQQLRALTCGRLSERSAAGTQ